jgi:hypothetical protein
VIYEYPWVPANINEGTKAGGYAYSFTKPESGDWTINLNLRSQIVPVKVWSAHSIKFGEWNVVPANDYIDSSAIYKINLSEPVTSATWDISPHFVDLASGNTLQAMYSIDGINFSPVYNYPVMTDNHDPAPQTFSFPSTSVLYIGWFGSSSTGLKAWYNPSETGTITLIPAGSPSQPQLQVSPASQAVTSASGTTTFSVSNGGTGDMAWTAQVVSGSDWLSISTGTSGNNAGTITANFSTNTDLNAPRTGTIRITAAGASGSPMDVTVVQSKALLPGDANKDGKVNFSDYLLLSQNFAKTGTTWEQGNFNTDNVTNFSDYLLLSQNFGKSNGASDEEIAQFKAASANLVAEEESQAVQQTLPCSVLGLAVLSVVGLALYSLSFREQE